MQMKIHFRVAAVCLAAVCAASTGATPDLKDVAAAVDAHYNHLHSLEARFTELYRGSGIERTESGTLWLKKPGKMRWEYRSPREKLFVSDGRDAWFYVPDDRQARKMAAKKLEDIRSPLAPGNVVFRGVPTAYADQISEIVLEVTPEHRMARIMISQVDGSTTEYRFTDQREDVPLADGRFEFKPPAGTETVDDVVGP